MVSIEPHKIPEPRYKGTVVCPRKSCHAEYKPGNWWRGEYEGTTGSFVPYYRVGENCCPVCGTEQREEE